MSEHLISAAERAQRSMLARIAANELWANCDDPAAHTAPARKAFLERFERQVDPDGTLTPQERARRAAYARKGYMQRLSLASSRARMAKAAVRRIPADEGPQEEGVAA